MTEQEWEDLCDGCGKCCSIRPTSFMCKGFDCATKKCRVYKKRTETYPCNNVTPQNTLQLHAMGILPDSCAYVRYKKGLPPLPRDEIPPMKMIPYELAPKIVKDQFESETRRWVAAKKEEKKRNPETSP